MKIVANKENANARWLALAASPVFALMALIAAAGAPPLALCSAGAGILPMGDMAMMYALMGFFHLAPWLTLVRCGWPNSKGD